MFVIITATGGQLYEMKYISKMPLPFLILLSQEASQSFSLKPHFTLDKNSPRITKTFAVMSHLILLGISSLKRNLQRTLS